MQAGVFEQKVGGLDAYITSELLGYYLNSMGIGTFEYVWGELERVTDP